NADCSLALHLARTKEDQSLLGKQGGSHPYFAMETDDCLGDYERMKKLGVRFHGEPEVRPYGTGVILEDPYGNRIFMNQEPMNRTNSNTVSFRYMIDDVDAAVAFYTHHLGFHLDVNASPAFASVVRGNLRLLLSGAKSSGRQPLPDGTKLLPGGWNRIVLEV